MSAHPLSTPEWSISETPHQRGSAGDLRSQPAPLLLTVPEAAKILQIGRRQLWEIVWRDEIPIVRLGRSVRIARAALETFVIERSRLYGA